MKKIIFIVIYVSALFLLNTCALEISNVIGPGGGYVFYDKGNYDGGWRYIECSSFDFGEINYASLQGDDDEAKMKEAIKKAVDLCNAHSDGRNRFGWEVPTQADLKKMLECFTYGLTEFSSGVNYFSVNNLYNDFPIEELIKIQSGDAEIDDENLNQLKDYLDKLPYSIAKGLPRIPIIVDGITETKVLYMDFGGSSFGDVSVNENPSTAKIRPILRF